MKLIDVKQEFYELNRLIEDEAEGFDPDTGEIIDNHEAIMELAEELKEKRDELADYLADKRTELKAAEVMLFEEINRLQGRRKSLQRQQDNLMKTIDFLLEGEKLKTLHHTFSYRRSESVDVIDEKDIPPEFIDFKPTIKKSELKKALKEGEDIKGAVLVEKINLSVR